ncbi:3-deoxy-D-manno-octulosonic acid transferase [Mesonia sp. K7]|uniref:3-deoxy-D-manno-octulosonic acid transferase n=1 Tax=Mesonia sp. K7 TaxID=2218606 RepID=UPI000DA6FF9B|nr:glycosyltransferase N-terminal domain-containing protein [Mesonia sp. K7]PZD78647.1 3-deoxy-D-manno-octulosonic acid transferase [Mesonia sp. K7]
MKFLYDIFISLFDVLLPFLGIFGDKMKLFANGRKNFTEKLVHIPEKQKKRIWFHTASLGEYEQAVPIMEKLKNDFEIIVTFFSPSGYEIKKNNPYAIFTSYLPIDTKKNAREFVDLAQPDVVLFIKYEIWPNFLHELSQKQIPIYLVSATFRENQFLFKPFGGFLRKALKQFQHVFVQDHKSLEILQQHQIFNSSVSGDTRFDRVDAQLQIDNQLDFIEIFLDNKLCMVCGSTWPEDDEVLVPFINQCKEAVKFIIAPHEIKPEKIERLKNSIQKPTGLYSNYTENSLKKAQVIIIDTVGLLSKIYAYADITYVGGAMGNTGLHNILEPATFGKPIIIGSNYDKFPEAKNLKKLEGLFVIKNKKELEEIFQKLTKNKEFREKSGANSKRYVLDNTGATDFILQQMSIDKVL